ncbi:hypothetical protein [Bradyrhizobium japonicum]|uniref:hypothetical protein n=1 Tax=Bradyrhizobium japonicum TaxID=375 RepID=UPI000B1C393C|nr:hypothetical protein [Bradyrhizobium japonicum]
MLIARDATQFSIPHKRLDFIFPSSAFWVMARFPDLVVCGSRDVTAIGLEDLVLTWSRSTDHRPRLLLPLHINSRQSSIDTQKK